MASRHHGIMASWQHGIMARLGGSATRRIVDIGPRWNRDLRCDSTLGRTSASVARASEVLNRTRTLGK